MQSASTAVRSRLQGIEPLGSDLPATAAFSLGRSFFGAATTASGVLQLVTGDFVRLVPKLPAWVPTHSTWAWVVGVVLVAAGLAILTGRMARTAASILGAMILVMVLLLYMPQMLWNPVIDRPLLRGFMWTNPLKSLALVGGAAILTGRLPERYAEPPGAPRGILSFAPSHRSGRARRRARRGTRNRAVASSAGPP